MFFLLEINCGEPPFSEGAEVDISHNVTQTYGSRVYYICKKGYGSMEGNSSVLCEANGSWSQPPDCYGMYAFTSELL